MNALQRAREFGQQRVDLTAHATGSGPDQTTDRSPVPAGDLIEQILVARIRAFGETGALEQLVGDALERRHDGDHRLVTPRRQQNASDLANRSRSGQRGAAEFEDSHNT